MLPSPIRFLLPSMTVSLLLITTPANACAEEIFVTIHEVRGNQILITKDDSGGGRGRGMRGGGTNAGGRGRGRGARGRASTPSTITVTVPDAAKITSAMRERRTFEFRVLAELPGGLRHRIFRQIETPLKARIVSEESLITEINVITGETDINQTGTSTNGETVIAVRPKRPPRKRGGGDR